MKHPIVLIEWLDAVSRDSWESLDEKLKPTPILSCGFLLESTEDYYTLALNIDLGNNNSSCVMTIPKSMATKFKKIKKA